MRIFIFFIMALLIVSIMGCAQKTIFKAGLDEEPAQINDAEAMSEKGDEIVDDLDAITDDLDELEDIVK